MVITVAINNIDDEAPVFAQTALTAQVAGGATAGTEVIIDIDATDDLGAGISYAFVDDSDAPVQTLGDFTINANTGVITVATAPTFVGRQPMTMMRTLTIRATDTDTDTDPDTDSATGTIIAPDATLTITITAARHVHDNRRSSLA